MVSGEGSWPGRGCNQVCAAAGSKKSHRGEFRRAFKAPLRESMTSTGGSCLKSKAFLLAAVCSSMLPCASTFAIGLFPTCDVARASHLVGCEDLARWQGFATSSLRPMPITRYRQVRRWGASSERPKHASTRMTLGADVQIYEALHAVGLSLPVAWFKMLVRCLLHSIKIEPALATPLESLPQPDPVSTPKIIRDRLLLVPCPNRSSWQATSRTLRRR